MKHLSMKSAAGHIVRVEAFAGSQLERVCEEAIAVAAIYSKPVTFSFNGKSIVVTATDSAKAVLDSYMQQLNADSAKRRASPEGLRAEQEAQERNRQVQNKVVELLAQLPSVVGCEPDLVAWVGAFALHTEYGGLVYDRQALANELEDAGYPGDAEVGENHVVIEADKHRMARYIIGQAVNCLRRGMPIHPIASMFAEQYARI